MEDMAVNAPASRSPHPAPIETPEQPRSQPEADQANQSDGYSELRHAPLQELQEGDGEQHEEQKKKRTRRRPRWIRWLFPRKSSETGDVEEAETAKSPRKKSRMGKLSSLFKGKSDDKQGRAAPENPYAQQPPAGQQSTPQPDPYMQYNNNQYNQNRFASQPSGLPSGPRAGLPGRPSPSGGDQPPAYSAYGGSGPATGTGFPKEKYGAADGFGNNRFDTPDSSRYGAPPARPSGGGYGNLDSSRGALFDGYKPPSARQPAGPGSGAGPQGQYGRDFSQMTEEEREEAEVSDYKRQILEEQKATNDVGRRNYQRMVEANERMRLMNEQLLQNTEALNRAELNMEKTKAQADVGGVNLDDLDAANKSMFNLVANSKAKVMLRAEKKQTIERQHQKLSAQTRIEEHNLEQRWQKEKQNYLPQKPKVLGARAKTDFSKFEFEDDTGEQRANNEEYDRIVQGLEEQSSQLVQNAAFQSFIINQQIKQIDRMGTKVEAADDVVQKNRLRLDTKYNKR